MTPEQRKVYVAIYNHIKETHVLAPFEEQRAKELADKSITILKEIIDTYGWPILDFNLDLDTGEIRIKSEITVSSGDSVEIIVLIGIVEELSIERKIVLGNLPWETLVKINNKYL